MLYDSSVSKIYENGHKISIASLAVPKFFEMVFVLMLSTVNTIMLSGYSKEAVAATSVSGQIINMIVVILNIITTGTSIQTSIELGKKSYQIAGKIIGTSAISITVFSLILGILASIFAPQLTSLMNLEGTARTLATEYMQIRCISLIVTMLMSFINNMLICNGYASCTFAVGILSNIMNVTFGYIILYSDIPLPISGVKGLAIGVTLAQLVALSVAVALFKTKNCPFTFVFDRNIFIKTLKVGAPSGLGSLSFTATQVLTTGFMAALGVSVLNAKVYVNNIISYTSKIGWAVAQGHSVLTGRYRGKGEYDKMKQLFRQNMLIAVSSNTLLSVAVFILHRPLVGLFSNDASIITLAATVMAVDIIVEIARAVNNISEQSLNANGDVKTTFVVPLFTCWLFGVLLAYILGIKCGLGLVGCWIGFAVDEGVKATLYSIRWRSGKWKNINI